jgi:hypothetical protein
VSLGTDRYLEILAPTTNPPDSSVADLVNHSTLTPAGWALHTGDLEGLVRRLRSAGFAVSDPVPGSRRRPDGAVLQWKTAAATGPGLELAPFFIEWAEGTPHPSITSPGGCGLRGLEVLAPDTTRLAEFFHAAGYRPLLRLAATGGLRLTLSCPRGPVSFSP